MAQRDLKPSIPAEHEHAALGLCIWQTAYGLPWSRYCQERRDVGYLCAEHHEDLRDIRSNPGGK